MCEGNKDLELNICVKKYPYRFISWFLFYHHVRTLLPRKKQEKKLTCVNFGYHGSREIASMIITVVSMAGDRQAECSMTS